MFGFGGNQPPMRGGMMGMFGNANSIMEKKRKDAEEIEEKVRRGEAKEEDYPEYFAWKREQMTKMNTPKTQQKNIHPKTGLECASEARVGEIIVGGTKAMSDEGPQGAINYLHAELSKEIIYDKGGLFTIFSPTAAKAQSWEAKYGKWNQGESWKYKFELAKILFHRYADKEEFKKLVPYQEFTGSVDLKFPTSQADEWKAKLERWLNEHPNTPPVPYNSNQPQTAQQPYGGPQQNQSYPQQQSPYSQPQQPSNYGNQYPQQPQPYGQQPGPYGNQQYPQQPQSYPQQQQGPYPQQPGPYGNQYPQQPQSYPQQPQSYPQQPGPYGNQPYPQQPGPHGMPQNYPPRY